MGRKNISFDCFVFIEIGTSNTYKPELQHKDIKVTIHDKNLLPDDSFVFSFCYFVFELNLVLFLTTSGVELYAMDRKIKVSNTIEARLSMIFNQILPEIRKKLFDVQQNKKYHD